jgi:hypothetical protein
VPISLHKIGARPLVDVAAVSIPGTGLDCGTNGFHPESIFEGSLSGWPWAKEAANAEINERRAALVGDIAALVRFPFAIKWQRRIGWRSDIARGEIGEQWLFAPDLCPPFRKQAVSATVKYDSFREIDFKCAELRNI